MSNDNRQTAFVTSYTCHLSTINFYSCILIQPSYDLQRPILRGRLEKNKRYPINTTEKEGVKMRNIPQNNEMGENRLFL